MKFKTRFKKSILSNYEATFMILAAVFGFVVVEALSKGMTQRFSAGQISFFRMAFGTIPPLLALVIINNGRPSFATKKPLSHIARAICFLLSFTLFVSAISNIDLAVATTISYTEVLMVGPLAWIILKEKITKVYVFAAFVGFIGTIFVMKPMSVSGTYLAFFMLILSALFGALGVVLVRLLGQTEHPALVAFYLSLIASFAALLSAPFGWVVPNHNDLVWLALIGLIGGLSQLLLTSAFQKSDAANIHPFIYTGLIWSIIFGVIFFNEVPDYTTYFGAFLIISSVLVLTYKNDP